MITDQKTIDGLKELNYSQVYEKGKEDARQEILEIIDHEINEEMEAIDKKVIRQTWDIVDELRYLKQQLTTNSEDGE